MKEKNNKKNHVSIRVKSNTNRKLKIIKLLYGMRSIEDVLEYMIAEYEERLPSVKKNEFKRFFAK